MTFRLVTSQTPPEETEEHRDQTDKATPAHQRRELDGCLAEKRRGCGSRKGHHTETSRCIEW
jgi:hypothetical protein